MAQRICCWIGLLRRNRLQAARFNQKGYDDWTRGLGLNSWAGPQGLADASYEAKKPDDDVSAGFLL